MIDCQIYFLNFILEYGSISNKKTEPTKELSFGSSAVFSKDPPLSAPSSRKV
jgi:hypothetical protein